MALSPRGKNPILVHSQPSKQTRNYLVTIQVEFGIKNQRVQDCCRMRARRKTTTVDPRIYRMQEIGTLLLAEALATAE